MMQSYVNAKRLKYTDYGYVYQYQCILSFFGRNGYLCLVTEK